MFLHCLPKNYYKDDILAALNKREAALSTFYHIGLRFHEVRFISDETKKKFRDDIF